MDEDDRIKLAELYKNLDCLSDETKEFMINDVLDDYEPEDCESLDQIEEEISSTLEDDEDDDKYEY